jgi:hypothetical protein
MRGRMLVAKVPPVAFVPWHTAQRSVNRFLPASAVCVWREAIVAGPKTARTMRETKP